MIDSFLALVTSGSSALFLVVSTTGEGEEVPKKQTKQTEVLRILYLTITPCGKGTQDGFWIPNKIPAEYVSLMPTLPENAKMKIIYGGTLTNNF